LEHQHSDQVLWELALLDKDLHLTILEDKVVPSKVMELMELVFLETTILVNQFQTLLRVAYKELILARVT